MHGSQLRPASHTGACGGRPGGRYDLVRAVWLTAMGAPAITGVEFCRLRRSAFSGNRTMMERWVPGYCAWPMTVRARGSRSRTASTWRGCRRRRAVPSSPRWPSLAEVDAAVVASAREGGARIVGKTKLTELCWSANGVNHWSGTPVNPRDPRRLPGGSSRGRRWRWRPARRTSRSAPTPAGRSGSRPPAAGSPGLKTTYGRISVKGVYPLAPVPGHRGPARRRRGRRRARDAAARAGRSPPRPRPPPLVAGRLAATGWDRRGRPRRRRRRRPGPARGRGRGHPRCPRSTSARCSTRPGCSSTRRGSGSTPT